MRSNDVRLAVVGLSLAAIAVGCGGTSEGDSQNNLAMGPTSGPGLTPPPGTGTNTPAVGPVQTPGPVPTDATPTAPDASPQGSGSATPQAPVPSATAPAPVEPSAPVPSQQPTPDGTVPAPTQAPTTPETPTDCGISVDSYDVSSAIPTVGIVSWSATGAIDSASIVFGPSGGELGMEAPVDLSEPGYQTYLLGMKGSAEYDFQVVASSGGQNCSSEVLTLETGPVATAAPRVTKNVMNEAAVSPGFIVSLEYSANGQAFIIDQDGDIVWWAPTPNSASAARLDFDSKYVWMVTGNPFPGTGMGAVRRVSIDGTEVENVGGMGESHHDLAPLPDGKVAALVHGANCSEVVEIGPDLSTTPTIDFSGIYSSPDCHANSILYHPEDDTYTVSDRSANLYVKVDRVGGALHWQFGGSNPMGDHIQGSWQTNHGHHVLPNGNFMFFNNDGAGGERASVVREFEFDLTSMTGTQVFSYTSASGNYTTSLGDVQRLPNGNTLVTYSNEGVIHEVTSGGDVVQTISTPGALGYAIHRESLYGLPPK